MNSYIFYHNLASPLSFSNLLLPSECPICVKLHCNVDFCVLKTRNPHSTSEYQNHKPKNSPLSYPASRWCVEINVHYLHTHTHRAPGPITDLLAHGWHWPPASPPLIQSCFLRLDTVSRSHLPGSDMGVLGCTGEGWAI